MRRGLAVSFLVGACSAAPVADSVVLDEFSIELPAIDASTSELTVENEGEFTHTMIISDERGRVVFATESIEPGGVATVPVAFEEGRYQFSCRIVVGTGDGAISDHFELGMVAEVDVEA